MPNTKMQFNIYIARKHKEYIEKVVDTTSVESNSDAVTLLVAYAHKYWSSEDWDKLAQSMKVFGEEGMVKLEC